MKALVVNGQWAPRDGVNLSEEAIRNRLALGYQAWRNLTFTIEDVPMPSVAPDDVLIATRVTSICGSDFFELDSDEQGYSIHWVPMSLPVVFGHQVGGVVAEVGKNVKHLRVGDAVSMEVYRLCGRCRQCHRGLFSMCENFTILGYTDNGVYAEYVAFSGRSVWQANALREVYDTDEAMFEVLSLTEALGTPYYDIFTRGEGFAPGAYVVFYNAGPKYWLQTQLGIALAKFAGAAKVIVVDMLDEGTPLRHQIYKELGADHIIKAPEVEVRGESVEDMIMEFTHGQGADFYWENADMPDKTLPITEKSMAFGAKFVQTARTHDRPTTVCLDTFCARGGQIFGADGHIEYGVMGKCLRAMAAGLDLRPAIAKRYDFRDIVEALHFGHDYRDGTIAIRMPSLQRNTENPRL